MEYVNLEIIHGQFLCSVNAYLSVIMIKMLSIMGQFVEHNRFKFWAMPKSIIGKKKKHNLPSLILNPLATCKKKNKIKNKIKIEKK